MGMRRAFLCGTLVAAVTVGAGACAPYASAPPSGEFPHQVTDGRVALAWRCLRPEPGTVRVEGLANNPYYPQGVRELELELYGVDAQGRNVSQTRAAAQDVIIHTNSPSRFLLDLRTAGGEVRFDLVYMYRIRAVAGLDPSGPQHNLARNICPDLKP